MGVAARAVTEMRRWDSCCGSPCSGAGLGGLGGCGEEEEEEKEDEEQLTRWHSAL